MSEIIPLISFIWFLYFFKNNRCNSFLTSLIFFSFFIFATNYSHFGLDIPIFRYLHRLIGVFTCIFVVIFVLRNKNSFLKDQVPLLIILLFFSILLSYIGNDLDVKNYLHYLRNYIFISGIVLYLYLNIDNNDKLEEVFKLIASITLILSVCLIIEKLFSNSFFSKASLFYPNSNYLAYALLPGFAICFFSLGKYNWLKVVLIFFGILSTGSISSLIAAQSIFIIFSIYKKNYYLIFSVIIVFLIFSSYILHYKINFGSDARAIIYQISFNIFKKTQ